MPASHDTIEKDARRLEMRGTCMAVVAAVCFGLVANAGDFLVSIKGMDPIQVTSLRLVAAGLVFLVWARARGERIGQPWRDRRDRVELIAAGLLGFGACQATFFLAIQASNGGTANVIQNTAPVMVLLYTLVHERRGPHAGELVSVLAVVAGAFVLATNGNPGSLAISPFALVMGLCSAAACAIYTLLPARLMGKFGAVTVSGWGLLLGGLILVPFCDLGHLQGTVDAATIAAFAYLVLVGTVATFGLYMSSLPYIGPLKAPVICLLEPVVSTLVTVTVFGEPFTSAEFLGIVIILAGVLTLTLSSARWAQRAQTDPM